MAKNVNFKQMEKKQKKPDISKIFSILEKKWQKRWEEARIFEAEPIEGKKKFYVLDMFPYPSGKGLHMGHAFVYSLGDIFARFKRLQGYNVLYPIGYDALGLPAENAAILAGIHPEEYTKNSIKNFMKQQKAMGWSYDWSRLINTSSPDYYKWDQWIFLKMLELGIAYRKKAPVNWCPKCKTVLANEQVINGKCWRHEDTDVEIKYLEQWFLKISDYAEELLEGLKKVNWPERAKIIQKNWIGKSFGTEIKFEIFRDNKSLGKWPIFTTRPDTIYGVTFMVISTQHPRLAELVTEKYKDEMDNFLKKIKSVSKKSMKDVEELDKEGVFTGSYAKNPLTGEKVPIWAGNFVIADYGSGMVMAVPAHDQRDFEFAKKYDIPIKIVIKPLNHDINPKEMSHAYIDDGNLINSDKFTGIFNKDAIEEITKYLEKKKLGKKTIQYKLRDWLISRQRYWGTPIPVIYCEKCGVVPVPEEDLPVKLPKDVKFGEGNPLMSNKEWLNVKCPKCGNPAKRETDTMDTFANSSWYYLRYTDPHNKKEIFNPEKANYWAPIDQYIGGPEHITMHLVYARFYTKFLKNIGLLNFDEPAKKYFTQGIVKGDDGEKMSKSRGNIKEPLEIINLYSADALRFYLISNSSPDKDFEWNEKGIQNVFKFLNKIFNYFKNFKPSEKNTLVESKLNKYIKEITELVEDFKHNLVTIKLRELFDIIYNKGTDMEGAKSFLKMLSIYCPFMTEELWERLGEKPFISTSDWPIADESKINKNAELGEELIKSVISDIEEIKRISGIEKPKKIKIFLAPKWKYDVYNGIKEGKDIKDFMRSDEYKKIGKELVKYIQSMKKNAKGEEILDYENEKKILKDGKEYMENNIKTKIELIPAEKSNESKAKQAEPMKPGILIE